MINKNAVIGNNCNISQFCMVGSTIEFAPTIGDNLYWSWFIVVKNILNNCTAAGNYKKVISKNNSERFIQNKYNI